MSSTITRHAYFPYIDGLRAIAVVSVLLYHLNASWLPGGFAGVDIFFVISGFVVSASIGTRERSSLLAFELSFLARRLQRIAPALIACLLVTALASALVIPDAWLSDGSQRTGRYAFFGLSNLVLSDNANSYFSPISEYNPYTHTWSLGVEEQFYLVFPLLFWAWTLAGRQRHAILGLFVLLGLGSLAYALRERSIDPAAAFYLLPSRFWELAAGVVLYQAMVMGGRRFDVASAVPARPWMAPLAYLGLAALAFGLTTATPATFPAPGALMPVVGTVLLLGVLHRMPGTFMPVQLLTLRPLLLLGRVSYSLYLWHWPVFVLFRWTCGLDTPVKQAGAVALALSLAALSWRYLEHPIRRARLLRAAPRVAVVACGIVLLFLAARLQRLIDHHQPAWSISQVARHATDWYPTRDQSRRSVAGCTVAAERQPVGEGFSVVFRRQGCADGADAPDVFAIGDSHAMAFGSMFADYVLQTGAKLTLYNDGGCPFLSLQPWREDSAHCRASAVSALDQMSTQIKPGDVVFLPSLRMPRVVDQWIRFPDDVVQDQMFGKDAVQGRAAAVVAGTAVLERLHARGARIVVEAPNLLLNAPAYRCADPWTHSNPICAGGMTVDRAAFERFRAPVLAAVERLAASVPGTQVFDPFPLLCPSGPLCDGYRDGRPLFFDGDHLSAYGNRLLLPAFIRAMRTPPAGAITAAPPAKG